MMNEDNKFTTPVGRLVNGSFYTPDDTNMAGEKLPNGQVEYWCYIAIPKQGETHWNQTEWGAYMYNFVIKEYGGADKVPSNFAWKISDGDDTTTDKKGRRECDKPGYAGCWILKPRTGFAPALHDCQKPGKPVMEEKDQILPGDWVQVRLNMVINRKMTHSVLLNHTKIGFIKHGDRIHLFQAEDVKDVGFMDAPASTPPAAMDNTGSLPQMASSHHPLQGAPVAAAPAPTPVTPHNGILQMPPSPGQTAAPPPAAPVRTMTPQAGGHTYEAYKARGWTDEQLIAGGLMVMA